MTDELSEEQKIVRYACFAYGSRFAASVISVFANSPHERFTDHLRRSLLREMDARRA